MKDINIACSKAKESNRKTKSLEAKIKKLEYHQSDSQDTHQEQFLLRTQCKEGLFRLKQTFYDQGERPGRMLAWCIKQLQNERVINSLQNNNNENIVDPNEINEIFKKFYEYLFSSEICPHTPELNNFLDSIHIPRISEAIKERTSVIPIDV